MSDVERVIAQLRDEATLAARGTFTLDRERAREKMRQFQLADPRRWILLLLRAAILRGATRVEISVARDLMVVRFDGPPLLRSDFEQLYASMFSSIDEPQIEARRDLALSLNAALALAPEVLRVESGLGPAAVAFVMRPGQPDLIEDSARDTDEATTVVRVRFRPGTGPGPSPAGRRGHEQQLLVDACRWSDTDIALDDERISHGIDAHDLRAAVAITGATRGRCGFGSAGDSGTLIVLQHGLVLTQRALASLPIGMVAIVDGTTLRTDVSHREPVEDEAWTSLLDAVREAAERSLVALAQEIVRAHETPHTASATKPWMWRLLRARLADCAPIELPGETDVVRALVELPLWRRVDRAYRTTAELLRARAAWYSTDAVPSPLPAGFESLLVLDEDEAQLLGRVVPFAVDRGVALRNAIEDEARRARPVAARIPAAAEVAPRKPRPTRPQPTPVAPRDRHRHAFLARPQRFVAWSVRPALSFGPIEVEHEGLHCTLGVLAGNPGELRDVARLCVLVERRVLTELKLPCPLPGIDAVVAGDLVANATWNGLGDDASRERVLTVLGLGLRALVVALCEAPGEPTPQARAVLFAGLVAPLFDPSFFTAWTLLRAAMPTPSDALAELVAHAEHVGLEVARPRIDRALAAKDPAAAIAALLPTSSAGAPRGSLRAAVTREFGRLAQLPLLGTPARSFAALEDAATPLEGLRPRELEVASRVLGRDAVAAPQLHGGPSIPGAPTPPIVAADADAHALAVAAPEPVRAPSEPSPASQPVQASSRVHDHATVPEPTDATVPEPPDEPARQPIARPRPPSASSIPSWLPAAVAAELTAILRAHRLPTDERVHRIEVDQVPGAALAQAFPDRIVLGREHAVVVAALASREVDPLLVAFATSAVYTAINFDLARITDEHEAAFLAAHARRVAESEAGEQVDAAVAIESDLAARRGNVRTPSGNL
ncbi:MAG: hypothetical protein K1X88_10280 [Nannocystaceae bacterium]|nr:hypothetical protein [Nannocystaceae bacterium]